MGIPYERIDDVVRQASSGAWLVALWNGSTLEYRVKASGNAGCTFVYERGSIDEIAALPYVQRYKHRRSAVRAAEREFGR